MHKRISKPKFEEIDVESLRGAVVFLDIDGTIIHQRGRDYPPETLKKIEEIKAASSLFFATNSRDEERSHLLEKETGVPFIKGLKPWAGVLKQIEHLGPKRRVVIGDKALTDGLFALFMGARFVRVERKLGEGGNILWRIAYRFDDLAYGVFARIHSAAAGVFKRIKKHSFPIRNSVRSFVRTYILADKFFAIRQQFKRDDAIYDLRCGYDLTEESVVFDLGGYTGEWAERIWKKYGCNIYIFEPVPAFYKLASEKFRGNPKVRLYNFGLSDKDCKAAISVNGVASSVFVGERATVIELRDIENVIRELKIREIGLMKINIEGGEFQVLPHLIETGLVSLCDNMQIEFHRFYPDAERLRDDIQKALEKTHHLTYDYPFFFENWERNG